MLRWLTARGRRVWAILVGLMLVTGCATPAPTPPPTPALVRVLATDLTEPLALDLALAYAENNPAVVVAPTWAPAEGLAASLQAGQADLALTVTPDAALYGTPLGYVPLLIVVNPANPLDELTLEQAQGLFSGQIGDWSRVGWQDQVAVVARAPDGDAGRAFAGQLWGATGDAVTPNARLAANWEAMRKLVAGIPNTVGYVIGPALDDSLKPLRLTDADGAALTLQLLVVAMAAGEPTGAARGWLAWAQGPAGQAVVAERHVALEP